MSLVITCPHCGQRYSGQANAVGEKVSCMKCGGQFVISERQQEGANLTRGMDAAFGSNRASQPIYHAPKERSRVFLHLLLIIVVGILIFICVQLSRLCEQMTSQMSDVNDKLVDVSGKLETISRRSSRIVGYKLINYTWEYPALMESEFRTAIEEGYEPAGYVCQNSLKGGFFLFVKRSK